MKPKDYNRNTKFLNHFSQCSPLQNHPVYGDWPEPSTFSSNIPSVFNCQSCRFPHLPSHSMSCFQSFKSEKFRLDWGPCTNLEHRRRGLQILPPCWDKAGILQTTQHIQLWETHLLSGKSGTVINIWNHSFGRHCVTFPMTETAEENESKLFPAEVKDKAEINSFLLPEKPFWDPCSDPERQLFQLKKCQ